MGNSLLRRYEQYETSDHGECLVELWAIGWELYMIMLQGCEVARVVGLDNAFRALEDYVNVDDPDWHETFNCNKGKAL